MQNLDHQRASASPVAAAWCEQAHLLSGKADSEAAQEGFVFGFPFPIRNAHAFVLSRFWALPPAITQVFEHVHELVAYGAK